MVLFKLIIPGRVFVKKNTGKVVSRYFNGVKSTVKTVSPQYSFWQGKAVRHILYARRELACPIGFPINGKFVFYFKNHQAEADLSNLYEGPQDELQTYGIIKDDRLIHSHDGSRKVFDGEEQERVEIELSTLDWYEYKEKERKALDAFIARALPQMRPQG